MPLLAPLYLHCCLSRKDTVLHTVMHEEACSAPACVAEQMLADEAVYRELGAILRVQSRASTVTIARGSSDNAASYLAYLSVVLGGHLVSSLPMSLVTLYRAPIDSSSILAIAISQSGRSPDLIEPMQLFRRGGAATISMVNDTCSPLAEACEWVLPLHAGQERSVAATKSFICSMVASARLIAHWCQDQSLLNALKQLPEALNKATVQDWTPAIQTLFRAERILVIGRGTGLSIAQEAALKLKETCGIQAEAFSGAELMHGPVVLVDAGYPLLIFAPRGPAQAGLLKLAEQMRQRGAEVVLIAPDDIAQRTLTMVSTDSEHLDPISAIQSFYGLVEAISRKRGRDPDQPPHLSKVTSTW